MIWKWQLKLTERINCKMLNEILSSIWRPNMVTNHFPANLTARPLSCGFVVFSRWFVFCWSKGLVSEAWARDPMMCFSFCRQFIIRKCFHCISMMLCCECDGGRTEINSGVSRIWSPAGVEAEVLPGPDRGHFWSVLALSFAPAFSNEFRHASPIAMFSQISHPFSWPGCELWGV